VAERYHAIRDFIEQKPESVFPVTREITLGGGKASAVEAFDAFYRLKAYKRRCDAAWNEDLILTPTAGRHPTIAAMQADPIRLNTELGYYTNFMNLLDYAAVAVPAAFRPDGLPFGVTLLAPAHQDGPLLELAARWQHSTALPLGATGQPLPEGAAPPAACPTACCVSPCVAPTCRACPQLAAHPTQGPPDRRRALGAGVPLLRPGRRPAPAPRHGPGGRGRRQHRDGSVGTARQRIRQLRRRHPGPWASARCAWRTAAW
jgi:hypothetical protein